MPIAPPGANAFDFRNIDIPGSLHGDVLFKGALGWTFLPAGTAGNVFSTNGPGADPAFILLPGGGNMLTATYDPTAVAGDAFDLANFDIASGAIGDLYIRDALGWKRLPAPGVANQVLTGNPASEPVWGAPTGDMLVATYDPTAVAGDAFDLANMRIPSEAPGDLYTRGTSNWERLGAGLTGEILRIDAVTGRPVWNGTSQASTRVLSGGVISIHLRNIASIQGAGGSPNTVTVDTTVAHDLTTGDTVIVTGTVNYDETTALSITVTSTTQFTYSTTTTASTVLENVGTISDASKFEVGVGVAEFADYTTDPAAPIVTRVNFGPVLAIDVTNIATTEATIVGVNAAGAILQFSNLITSKQKRTTGTIGALAHADNASISDATNRLAGTDPVALGLTVADLAAVIGNINSSGNLYSPNGANLQIDKTAGLAFIIGANRLTDIEDPNMVASAASTPVAFFAAWRTSAADPTAISVGPQFDVDIGVFDDGTGGSPLPNGVVAANNFVTHRIFLLAVGVTVIQYGQATHATLADALAAINTEGFAITPLLANSVLRGFLTVKGNATDLSNATQAAFVEANQFGAASGAASGGLTTLQGAYGNSPNPEIITDATRGAVQFRRGSAADTDDVIAVENGAATPTFQITGEGRLTMAGAFESPIRTLTAAGTIGTTDYTVLLDAAGGAFTQVLPTAVGIDGRIYVLKRINSGGNNVTIDGNAAETIEGATTQLLTLQNETITIQSDGANWRIIGRL